MTLLFAALSGCSVVGFGLYIANRAAALGGFELESSISYGELEAQHLNIYKPLNMPVSEDGKLPVVVFFYGGCWGACTTYKREHYAFVAETLTANDYITVIPDYRLFPKVHFPEIISDSRLAVEWVISNIEDHGGDPDRIFLMGHSAGAHLAATLHLDERYLLQSSHDRIRGFIGLAGPYDFFPFTEEYQKDLFAPERLYPDSQPINFVDGSEPPMLLLYGDKDDVVRPRNIENLSAKADQLGISVTTRRYEKLNHGSLLAAFSRPLRNNRPVVGDVISFLDANAGERH